MYIHEPPQQYSLPSKEDVSKKTILKLTKDQGHGPNGEAYCWWQVTVKGGRETRDIDAIQLAKVKKTISIYFLTYC